MKYALIFLALAAVLGAAPENQVSFSQVITIRAKNASDARVDQRATQTAVQRATRTFTVTPGLRLTATPSPTASRTPSR